MIESKPLRKFESKIENLKIGEFCGHELVWENPESKNYKETIAKNMVEGIGQGISVISPKGEDEVGLLVDYDFDTNPLCRRFIFVYFDKKSRREFTVDTLYHIGWTVDYKDKVYKL
jgi:hypothetical protein